MFFPSSARIVLLPISFFFNQLCLFFYFFIAFINFFFKQAQRLYFVVFLPPSLDFGFKTSKTEKNIVDLGRAVDRIEYMWQQKVGS